MKLSIIIPCYNSEKTIESVVNNLEGELSGKYEYEVILVNDCSKDKTFEVIKNIAGKNDKVTAVNLVKNSGQHAAMMAGFKLATGDLISTIDDDGQTPVEHIFKLIEKLDEGYDVVCAKYMDRAQPSLFRRFGTKMSRAMSDWMLDKPEGVILSTFFVARKVIMDEVIKYDQPYPFVTGLISRVTKNIANVEMNQNARQAGSSGYSFKKLLKLWLNGFTAFSIKPLRISTITGVGFAGIGFIGIIVIIFRKIFGASVLMGWSSMVCLMLIIGGIIMCMLGMLGEYVGRIYMCINETPQYVIKEIIKKED